MSSPTQPFQASSADGTVHLHLTPEKARAIADAWENWGARPAVTDHHPVADLEAAMLRRAATTAAMENGDPGPDRVDVPLFGERHLQLLAGGAS